MMERLLRLIAGAFILIGLALVYYHSKYWLIMTGVVGFNLFQSGFTNWCPTMTILRLLGVKENKP